MKNLLLISLLALLLAPGAVATDPAAASEGQDVAQSSACNDSRLSPDVSNSEVFAAWLDRIGAKALEPDAAVRMAAPACPDVQPCTSPCVEGDGPCFLKPLGSSECCFPEGGCFRCEGGTEIYVVKCPCLGAGCPRQSLELSCG